MNSLNQNNPQSFLRLLRNSYPQFVFKPNHSRFSFRYPNTIFLGSFADPHFHSLTLHELGHALLYHSDYQTDLERLKMELAAWEKAKQLAPTFNIKIDQNLIETELDTYRNWLHTKSKCKKCGLTKYQTPDGIYHCPHCDHD